MEGDFERASFYTLGSGREVCMHNVGHVHRERWYTNNPCRSRKREQQMSSGDQVSQPMREGRGATPELWPAILQGGPLS